jgi:hypothetical protein
MDAASSKNASSFASRTVIETVIRTTCSFTAFRPSESFELRSQTPYHPGQSHEECDLQSAFFEKQEPHPFRALGEEPGKPPDPYPASRVFPERPSS